MHRQTVSILLAFSSWVACSSLAAAQSVVLGGACTPAVDIFGCQGTNYMSCDPTSQRWILQNQCPTECLGIPSFGSNCGRNSHGIETTTTTTNAPATSTTSTGTPSSPSPTVSSRAASSTSTSTSISISPTASAASSSLPDTGSNGTDFTAIWASIVSVVIALLLAALAFLLWRRHQKKKSDFKRDMRSGAAGGLSGVGANQMESGGAMLHDEIAAKTLFASYASGSPMNVASVLEKKYVVNFNYEPTADDEIQLTQGDSVRLHLLFNDGWAKGLNETTGRSGLLPCACIAEVRKNSMSTDTTPTPETS